MGGTQVIGWWKSFVEFHRQYAKEASVKNRFPHDPDTMMVVSITIDCNIRDTVPIGDRPAAVALLEARVQGEFGEFQRHLAEQGFDALFRINRRVTIGR